MIKSITFLVTEEKKENGISIFEGKLIFQINGEELISFKAMSGKWGNGALPYGDYGAQGLRKLSESTPSVKSFMKEAWAWICNLIPKFKTDRTDLCIHPDGGVYGTLGCIGIEENDIQAYYVLSTFFQNGLKEIPLTVKKA